MSFGLVWRDGGEHAAHAKRFIAELGTQPVLAARRGVAFVEKEVDDLKHREEPLRELRQLLARVELMKTARDESAEILAELGVVLLHRAGRPRDAPDRRASR